MKKRELWLGLGMIAGGILFLLAALLLETPLDSLFCGFFGALIGPGAVQVYKYVKWTKLETADSYQRHLEEEQIELRDERKSMLRDRSGRYAYVLGCCWPAPPSWSSLFWGSWAWCRRRRRSC